MNDDLRQFIGAFLLVVGGLLPIVNPLGSAPIFLAMTHGSDEHTRAVLAAKVAINSFVLLMASMVFGTLILKMFGLSVPVVQVAGGAVLCALGWNMLGSDPAAPADSQPVDGSIVVTRAFYPLTLPLTVDPGAISVAIALGANHAHGIEKVVVALLATLAGIGFIAGTVWFAYRYAERGARRLGHARLMVLMRLSAFIVLCIGVEIGWNGVRTLITSIDFSAPPASVVAPHQPQPVAP